METIAIFGAGGTMGTRVSNNLSETDGYSLLHVEPDPMKARQLHERGVDVVSSDEAAATADVAVLAIPDKKIGAVCHDIAPKLGEESMIFVLDPAAAYAGELPEPTGISIFVTHPCHPHLFEAPQRRDEPVDWFGGQGDLEQPLVCALYHGPDRAYRDGEQLAREVFAPVSRTHRVSVEEMAILEPVLVENLLTPFVLSLQEGVEEAVALGVSREAAEDMLFGHMRTQIAMCFGWYDHPLSEGAELAVEQGIKMVMQDDWKDLFTIETTRKHCEEIAGLQ